MTTLEELYGQLGYGEDSHDYDAAREAKVAEIAEYIRDFLKEPDSAEAHAEAAMASAESSGSIHGNTISAEVRGFYTNNGNPLPFSV